MEPDEDQARPRVKAEQIGDQLDQVPGASDAEDGLRLSGVRHEPSVGCSAQPVGRISFPVDGGRSC